MKSIKTLKTVLILAGAVSTLALAACSGRPSNVLRVQPDASTANSGITAGTIERPAENTGASQ
jgi:hypothetical protein